jgi:hypothetical protein
MIELADMAFDTEIKMKMMLHGAICLLGMTLFAQEWNPGQQIPVSWQDTFTPAVRGGVTELFSTLDGVAPIANTVSSQHFTDFGPPDPAPKLKSFAADDFVIPGEPVRQWRIDTVFVQGAYFSTAVPPQTPGVAASVNVYILDNGAGDLPDTIDIPASVVYSAESLTPAFVDWRFRHNASHTRDTSTRNLLAGCSS